MKICGISDLHGTLPTQFENHEVMFICGDISSLNIQINSRKLKKWLIEEFKPWCESLPNDKIFFIAGNHDRFMEAHPDFMYENFTNQDKVTYLCNDNYIYTSREGKEYSIYGTPYCKKFGNWFFMRDFNKLKEIYSNIPENLDILITHDQPYGYGDILLQQTAWYTGEHLGNKALTEEILIKQPKILLTGHLHSTSHKCVPIINTKRYNVSLKDEFYDLVYEPLYLEI